MALSAAACSSDVPQLSSQASTAGSVVSESESSVIQESYDNEISEEYSSDSSKKYQSLYDFVVSDEGQKEETGGQEIGGDVIKFELLAEDGNRLVYQSTYNEYVEADEDDFKEVINPQTELYAQTAEYLEEVVDIDKAYVVVRYINADDTVIYEQEFDAYSVAEEISDDDDVSTEKKYATLEEFINSDEAADTVEMAQDSLENSGMDFSLEAEGQNRLIYKYTFKTQLSDDVVEQAQEKLDGVLDSYQDLYNRSVEQVENVVDVDDLVIVLRYVNADGTTIAEKSYE